MQSTCKKQYAAIERCGWHFHSKQEQMRRTLQSSLCLFKSSVPKILLSVRKLPVADSHCYIWGVWFVCQVFIFENIDILCEEFMAWIRVLKLLMMLMGGGEVRELISESPGNFFKNYECPALTTDLCSQNTWRWVWACLFSERAKDHISL